MKRPHRFEITIEPSFGAQTKYEIDHGAVAIRQDSTVVQSATPTLAQWSGFWRLCQFIDLWNWLPEYTSEEVMRDGQSWQLNIACDKNERIVSAGHNAYPSLESVNLARPTMDRFGLLLHFFDITLLTNRFDMRDDYNAVDA